MSKSLELALCDTQGQLFELSGDRGISSEAFIKAFMTSDISKDMDSEFNHVQWAGKEYIYSRMEDECKDALAIPAKYTIKKHSIGRVISTATGTCIPAKAAKKSIAKPLQKPCRWSTLCTTP